MTDAMQQIEATVESIERTWRRYGLPAVIFAWASIGFAAGLIVGLAIGGWA